MSIQRGRPRKDGLFTPGPKFLRGIVRMLPRVRLSSGPGRPALPFPTERDLAWIALYRDGKTLQEIGEEYGVTRERVRQRLAKNGIRKQEGGHIVRAKARAASHQAARRDKCLIRWGMTPEARAKIPSRLITAFKSQRKSAANRGIEWRLNLREWMQAWEDSGKLSLRGRGRDLFCMARVDDSGPYALSNVKIITIGQNSSEYMKGRLAGKKPRTRVATGVYCLYPGYSKPWIAAWGRKKIGYFATADEAIAARSAYEKNLPQREFGGFCRPGFQSERRTKKTVSDQVATPCQTKRKAA